MVKEECQFCGKKEVVFDGVDDAGHLNNICESCGEPQEDKNEKPKQTKTKKHKNRTN